MTGFAVRRGGQLLLVAFALTLVVFVLQQISNVDLARVAVGETASKASVAAARHRLGYDDPLPIQYVRYIGHALRGDLGRSLRTGQPVTSDLGQFGEASLELMLFAALIGVPMAFAFGTLSARRARGSGVLRVGMITLAAAPSFLLAVLAVLLFYKTLAWLPSSGRTSFVDAPTGPTGLLTVDGILAGRPGVTFDALKHLVLPATCLATLPAVAVGRVLRGGILTNLRLDHVRTARAIGLSERAIIRRHTLRNAAGPTLAMSGLMAGAVFANLAVIETIFAWPGIGQYVAQAIPQGDFPAIAGVTLMLGALYLVVNTIVDVLQAAADPRIRA
jgi:peptide/nickel transport system permease protein